MPESLPGWTRHLVYRAERVRTTWKLRLAVSVLVFVALWSSAGWWAGTLGSSLVCHQALVRSDAILVDNFDPDYLLFERARELRRGGLAARVLVPVPADAGTQIPNDVALGIAEVMARISRIGPIDGITIPQVEPITLNAARAIQAFLEREHIRSVIVVSPLFRSRRASLIYEATLGRAGIGVSCEPVGGARTVSNWRGTWHGIQNVLEQWLKLQYYRRYVLPFRLEATAPS